MFIGSYEQGDFWEGKAVFKDEVIERLAQYQNGEVISETVLTSEKKNEIVKSQMATAHSLLSSLGYGVGNGSTLPNPLLTSALQSYCKESEAFEENCPDLNKVDLRVDDFLAALQSSVANKQTQLESAAIIGSGSAFRINEQGSLVTNSHVINDCLAVSDSEGNYYKKTINNQVQDLAVLDLDKQVAPDNEKNREFALLSDEDIALGESIYVAGFPYVALLKSLNFTEGTVSSVSGIGGNTQHFQITAPMQPGNSGGPVLSETGSVIGIAVGELNETLVQKLGGGLPQNVNFGIDVQVLKKMLENNSIPFEEGSPFFSFLADREKVAGHAQAITEQLNCWGEK